MGSEKLRNYYAVWLLIGNPGFELATQKSHIIWDDWKLQWKDNPERLPIQVSDVLAGEN